MSLNDKYRPKSLNFVVGQDDVCETLNAQMQDNKVPQCMLFVGPAGTGKTTVARIVADYLNAEIFELDAASNNGVDNVRQLQEEAFKRSVLAKGKCFILDECHSFSNQAWQAFLKIIEEPPKDVYFIFCTTESQKIPETILSRVQRYDFKRVSDIDITIALNHICAYEGLSDINVSGLEIIAEHSHGCVRQAITYLDKILSSGGLKDDVINSVLGLDYGEFIEKFVNSMTAVDNKEANKTDALEIVTILNLKGINYKTFFNSCFSYAIEQAKKTSYEVKDKYLSLLEWIIIIREHLMNEDMPFEYIESMILLR
jgi:DNA polymerase III subunit gamma/tau